MNKSIWAFSVLFGITFGNLFLGSAAVGADVVGYRDDGTGIYAKQSPVYEWSKESNIIWATPMPDWANGSPTVSGNLVFTTSEPDKLICVNRKDGAILWEQSNSVDSILTDAQKKADADAKEQREVLQKQVNDASRKLRPLRKQSQDNPDNAELKKEVEELGKQVADLREQLGQLANYYKSNTAGDSGRCSQTPVCDGKFVYMSFGSGVTVCYDLKGNRKWGVFVEMPNDSRGQGASAVLADGKLLAHYDSLIALDAKTGAEVWRAKEAKATFGTPFVTKIGRTLVAITPGGAVVRIADGKVLLNKSWFVKFGSIGVWDNVVYGAEAEKAFAVKLTSVDKDTITSATLWETKIKTNAEKRNYGGPMLQDGIFYTCSDGGLVSALDAATGAIIWDKDTGIGNRTYSMVLAGDKLFVCSDNGKIHVLQTGREYKLVAENDLEKFRGFPSFDKSLIYLRGLQHLYCIGKK